MRRKITLMLLALAACSWAQTPADESETTVKQLMVDVITPAANSLRAAEEEEPESDARWESLEYSARVAIRALQAVKDGGTGPNDIAWANEPSWDAYTEQSIQAIEAALSAIEARDAAAFRIAAGVLHAPCEACHLDYLPGIDPEAESD